MGSRVVTRALLVCVLALGVVTFATEASAEAPKQADTKTDANPTVDKTAEEKASTTKTPSLVDFKMGLEVSAYKDNDATAVITPGVTLGVENDVAGWGIDAAFLADVVTSASVDISATASPYWTDERFAPALSGHFKVGDTTISGGGAVSVESDYIAVSANAGVAVDLAQKTVTPSFVYSFGWDLAGRRGTPYSVYSKKLQSHGLETAVSFVLNKSTILVPTATVLLEFGDSAKPYRYVPIFPDGYTPKPGVSIAEVQSHKLRAVEERVPQSRQRYAGSALLAHRFSSATLRLDERLYGDSWGMLATTTDFLLPIDVGRMFRIWPHLRFHAQKGVDFWNIDYKATEAIGTETVPGYRAGDRELGPLLGATLGAGFRVGGDSWGLTLKGDAIYTRFLDALYITQRIAGLVTTQLEAKF